MLTPGSFRLFARSPQEHFAFAFAVVERSLVIDILAPIGPPTHGLTIGVSF